MKTISVCCQKGGTGKTTTTAALSALYAKAGNVLLIDADQQRNLTDTTTDRIPRRTIADVLQGKCSLTDAVIPLGTIDLLPGYNQISDSMIKQILDIKKLLAAAPYDTVIIDCPPSLGRISLSMIAAADTVIIPTTADLLGYMSFQRTRESVEYVQGLYHGKKDTVIVLTRYNGRAIIDRDYYEVFTETGLPVYTVRNSIAVKEAQAMRQNVIDYAPRSTAAQDYKVIYEQLLKGE